VSLVHPECALDSFRHKPIESAGGTPIAACYVAVLAQKAISELSPGSGAAKSEGLALQLIQAFY
jgi:hypothetical protein